MSNYISSLYSVTFTAVLLIRVQSQQLPPCPQSLQWFPQGMPSHCVMAISCSQCNVNCNACPPPCRCVPPAATASLSCPACSCTPNFSPSVPRPKHCPPCPACPTPLSQPTCPPCSTPCGNCMPVLYSMCSPCHASCACKPQALRSAQCPNPPCMPMTPVMVIPIYAPRLHASHSPQPHEPRDPKPKYRYSRNGYEYEQEPQIIPVLSYVFPNGTVLYQKKISEASAARWLKSETKRRYYKNDEDYASEESESDEEEYEFEDHEVAKQILRSVSEQKKMDSRKQKILARKKVKRIQDRKKKIASEREPSVYKVGKVKSSKRRRHRQSEE